MAKSRARQMASCENKIMYWTEWMEKEVNRARLIADNKITNEGKDATYWNQWAEDRADTVRRQASATIAAATEELQRLMAEESEQA